MTMYYETVIPAPGNLRKIPYQQHQWLVKYLSDRNCVDMDYHYNGTTLNHLPMIKLRSSLPVNEQSKKVETAFDSGQRISFVSRFCIRQNRKRIDSEERYMTYVKAPEVPNYLLSHLRSYAGVQGDLSWCSENQFIRLGKNKGSKEFIPCVDFVFNGTIEDPELFQNAMAKGIGKKRKFGFGHIELIDS